ncbi:MAG: galactokinase [Planctomycetota bacterium]|jgi:galactokinase
MSRSSELQFALERHATELERRFGPGGPWRSFFSPGRVNLFGAHLDYNGGPVMPTAIDRGTFISLREGRPSRLRLASTLDDTNFDIGLDELPDSPQGGWYDYPIGVVRTMRFALGADRIGGIDVMFGGDLPIGAGLSSSASICVGFAFALNEFFDLGLDPIARIGAALDAERGYVGVQCGIMDPYAVGLAKPNHVLWLECKSGVYEHVPLDFERVAIGVADTGVRRELAQGEFNKRVAECAAAYEGLKAFDPQASCLAQISPAVLEEHAGSLDEALRRRALHVVHENARAYEARAALERGDLAALGDNMLRTHASLRELYEVSCHELDVLVEAAGSSSAIFGGRLTGAGFGGCVVILADPNRKELAREDLTRAFVDALGREPVIEFFGGDAGPREY